VSSQHLVKNRILRQLSADELKSVQPWLTPVELRSNVVLHEPGDAMERVYFPLSGMISLLAVMQSGEAIETGIVGADGLTQEFLSHMLGVRRNTFDRGPCRTAGRADPVLARTYQNPQPRRSRRLCLRMLFGDPRGDRQINGTG
jgi:hypothetical protein